MPKRESTDNRTDKIAKALEEERFLTLRQMACLTRDGKGSPVIRNSNEYPESYDDAVKTASRMERRGDVLRHNKGSKYVPTLFSKPGVDPVSPEFEAHEVECGWLYVAYAPHCDYWDWRWTPEEQVQYGIHRKDTFKFDRRMLYKGAWVHFEHDRGSRSPAKLREQINAYVDFSNRFPKLRFHVVYTLAYARAGRTFTPEYIDAKIEDRKELLLDEFSRVKRGSQFALARYDRIVVNPKAAAPELDPLGAHFLTPLTGGKVTLDQLTGVPNR